MTGAVNTISHANALSVMHMLLSPFAEAWIGVAGAVFSEVGVMMLFVDGWL